MRRGWFQCMSVPGLPLSTISFCLSKGDGGFNMSLQWTLPVSAVISFYHRCLHLVLPLSLHYTHCKRGPRFSLSLHFPLITSFLFWQSEKGVGLNQCLHLSFPLLLLASLRKMKKRNFNIGLYLAFPLSCLCIFC